ncbi:MAG TPA: HD domain-containing protein [Deltaproteobacteria bacterium]|nr:HD domain-containing protein [Deltaproteobacteria bacterium]HPR52072.1 HD domain-containing protein [Deltaproteobacteria bacterium]
MSRDIAFFKSKVAQRIFILFIICAVAPMGILSAISFFQIDRQFDMNEREQLYTEAKSKSTAIFERLMLVDSGLKILATNLNEDSSKGMGIQDVQKHELLNMHYTFLGLISADNDGPADVLFGNIFELPRLNENQIHNLDSDKTILFTVNQYPDNSSIFMARKLDKKDGRMTVLLAGIRPEYLIGLSNEEIMLEQVKISVIEDNRIIYSSLPHDCDDDLLVGLPHSSLRSGSFKWVYDHQSFLAGCAQIFTKSRFEGPLWTLVLSESEKYVQAPMQEYKKAFIIVFILTILIVLLLSTNQIRKNLIPLVRLQRVTRNISRGDFSSRVEVDGGDEFAALAESFNNMAEKLDHQFRTLRTMATIDHAVLSVLDAEKIVDTFISRAGDVLPCDSVSICLPDSQTDDTWHNYTKDVMHPGKKICRDIQILGGELGQLYQNKEYMLLDYKQAIPRYLKEMSGQGMRSFVVLPIHLKDKVSAIVSLGNREQEDYSRDFLIQARQISDRIAVALSNTNLVEDLNMLNWGTLVTLARVVDAKSHWTAGHSERVADLAVTIGTAMGLSKREITSLKKAGLLHDIGKISTPHILLEKPGKLTDEEFGIIREHPVKGAHILEPITPYREIIPGVLQHHERFDGRGYPHGISGREISLYARIIAVADAYDAMVSDRPYRRGKSQEFVIDEIRQQAGHQFDPIVVKVFLSIFSEDEAAEACVRA